MTGGCAAPSTAACQSGVLIDLINGDAAWEALVSHAIAPCWRDQMSRTTAEKRAAFHALHQQGCFILPNPWDIGSARMLQHLGFEALASTSSGYAWSTGRPDYAVTRDGVLQHPAALSAAVDLPINADFESGFATEPEQLAVNVALAIQTGIAGLSIEDRDLREPAQLYDSALALERLRAARAA